MIGKQNGIKWTLLSIAILTIGGMGARLSRGKQNCSAAEPFGYRALMINGKYVSESVFREEQNKFFLRWRRNAEMLRKTDEERNDLLLEEIINRVALEEYLVNRSGIKIPPREVERYLSRYIRSKYPTPSEFQNYLDSVGCADLKALQKEIELYLLRLKCLPSLAGKYGVTVTKAEIDERYVAQREENRKVDISHILISDQQRTSQESSRLANLIYGQLLKGASFETMAVKYSDDLETKSNGGKLSSFCEAELPPEYAGSIFDAKPGRLIPVFHTSYGWEIVKVNRYIDYAHPRREIAAMLRMEKFLNSEQFLVWLGRVKSQMEIEILDPAFNAYRCFKNQKYETAGQLYETIYRQRQQEFYLDRALESYRLAKNWDKVSELGKLERKGRT
jgi:hypothetical protein